MELQHVNVKLLVKDPEEVNLEPLIPVFHSWIQDRVCDELLVDIADYRHVHDGPGVILIGHEANYSVDNTDNRLGVRYNRKAPLEGSNQDRLTQAARAALLACDRLEHEPLLEGKLRFGGQEVEVLINDRLLVPNLDSTQEAIRVDFEEFLSTLWGGSEYSLQFNCDSRRLLSASIKASSVFTVTDLLRNLSS